MKNSIIKILFLFIIIINISCNNNNNNILPASTGKTAELLIVCEKNIYEGIIGEEIKAVFAKDVEILPQSEPMFNLVNIPFSDFKNMFKTYRNIFMVDINPELSQPTLDLKHDLWAQPQTVIQISVPSDTSLTRLLKKHGNVFTSLYLKTERQRLINAFKGIEDTKIRQKLKNDFGFEMIFPEGYYIAVQNKDFIWIRKETEATSQSIIIYTQPFTDTMVFNSNYIINLRDSITKKYIPGHTEGSYMTTEKKILPVSKSINFKGRYAIETRGLWKLANGCCMGGPFVNYTFADDSNKKIITIDGSVYAPSTNKRDFLLQVESIAYSFE